MRKSYVASAPGKVNLHLGVGEAGFDGYHELATVFQAVDRREVVRLVPIPGEAPVRRGSIVKGITTTWVGDGPAPAELAGIDTRSNLAWRAVNMAVASFRQERQYVRGDKQPALPRVRIEVEKSVFIAGGMAGGSADAAAALLAANAFIEDVMQEPRDPLIAAEELAPELGADVPFAVLGGNAVGTGRGDDLRPLPRAARWWWVFINPATTISTGEAFELLDEMRFVNPELRAHLDTSEVEVALAGGDPRKLAAVMHNDLEAAAVTMRPHIGDVLDFGNVHGVRALVSGSGPTVAVLCESSEHADEVLAATRRAFPDYQAFATSGAAPGAVLL